MHLWSVARSPWANPAPKSVRAAAKIAAAVAVMLGSDGVPQAFASSFCDKL
eukprot:SAG11_NODE_32735_length_281_cov_0.846154_1_plen_50_part_10